MKVVLSLFYRSRHWDRFWSARDWLGINTCEGRRNWIESREKLNDNASPTESLPNQHADLEQDLLVVMSHWVAMARYLCPHFTGNGYPWEEYDLTRRLCVAGHSPEVVYWLCLLSLCWEDVLLWRRIWVFVEFATDLSKNTVIVSVKIQTQDYRILLMIYFVIFWKILAK